MLLYPESKILHHAHDAEIIQLNDDKVFHWLSPYQVPSNIKTLNPINLTMIYQCKLLQDETITRKAICTVRGDQNEPSTFQPSLNATSPQTINGWSIWSHSLHDKYKQLCMIFLGDIRYLSDGPRFYITFADALRAHFIKKPTKRIFLFLNTSFDTYMPPKMTSSHSHHLQQSSYMLRQLWLRRIRIPPLHLSSNMHILRNICSMAFQKKITFSPSTVESEYVAASQALQDILWPRRLIFNYNHFRSSSPHYSSIITVSSLFLCMLWKTSVGNTLTSSFITFITMWPPNKYHFTIFSEHTILPTFSPNLFPRTDNKHFSNPSTNHSNLHHFHPITSIKTVCETFSPFFTRRPSSPLMVFLDHTLLFLHFTHHSTFLSLKIFRVARSLSSLPFSLIKFINYGKILAPRAYQSVK